MEFFEYMKKPIPSIYSQFFLIFMSQKGGKRMADFRLYPDRNLIPLLELLEKRKEKVTKLVEDEELMLECGDQSMITKYKQRIDEYASVVEYLNMLHTEIHLLYGKGI